MKMIPLKIHLWLQKLIIFGVFSTSIANKPFSANGYFSKAVVVTDAIACQDIIKTILDLKGNAIDIAIVTELCVGIVHPHTSGLGGGFLMTFYNRSEGKAYFLDARETAPSKSTEDMYKYNPIAAAIGGSSIAVPGDIAGLFEAHRRFGRLKWNSLFKHLIDLCYQGFPVSKHFAYAIFDRLEDRWKNDEFNKAFINPETKKLYVEGDIMKRPDLAKTLTIISNAKSYKELFNPQNEFFKVFFNELQSTGSIITEEDLINYKPLWKEPSNAKLSEDLFMFSSPLPGSGVILALILNIMKNYENSIETTDAAILFYHRLMEAFKFAFGQRVNLEDTDDPEVLELAAKLLTSSEAETIRKMIMDKGTYSDPTVYSNGPVKEDKGTAHFNIITEEGDAISLSTTTNLWFGSRMMLKSSGIILNNEMDDFVNPGQSNYFGVVSNVSRNLIVPGRRPFSSMVPTLIVNRLGDAQLAIGAVGGTRITTLVAYVIILNQMMGYPLNEAIDMYRVHHQLTPNEVEYEETFPKDVLDGLVKRDHNLATELLITPAVQAIERTYYKLLHGVSDFRKEGCVVGY